MHLALNPLFAVAWRAPGRVQIGLDPDAGFILDGIATLRGTSMSDAPGG